MVEEASSESSNVIRVRNKQAFEETLFSNIEQYKQQIDQAAQVDQSLDKRLEAMI